MVNFGKIIDHSFKLDGQFKGNTYIIIVEV